MEIIIIDDHPVTQFGVELILQQYADCEIKLTGTYTSGNSFLDDFKNKEADLLLVDLQLPDMPGYDIIKYLRSVDYKQKIGIYTSFFNQEHILNAIKHKADGIMSKAIKASDFIYGVNEIFNNQDFVCIGENHYSSFPEEATNPYNRYVSLTKREKEILQYIKEGVKNKDIANILNITLRTVEFHRRNIYMKYEVDNLAGLLNKVSVSNYA